MLAVTYKYWAYPDASQQTSSRADDGD
jgi:hypothetical protein